jgi:hypothetical protein
MAQNWVPKQATWVSRFSSQVVALLSCADSLTELCNEFVVNQYGTGGANAIIDSVVQTGAPTGNGPLPAATALQVAEAEGAVSGTGQVLSLIGISGTQRGYLENMRP